MFRVLETVNGFVWGVPALLMILGVGMYLSMRTGWVQLRLFPKAVREFTGMFRRERIRGISSRQALCTALAATVGTGNIAGVAGAIALGGPGAIFWMWVCALLGMGIKFAEATLAVHYRVREKGEYVGGPMYMIRNAMDKKWHFLAVLYAFFGVAAAFGVGNATQINAVVGGIDRVVGSCGGEIGFAGHLIVGLILAVLIGAVVLGGAKRIGQIAEIFVPFAAIAYMLLAVVVLLARWQAIPAAFIAIFKGAFSPTAVSGGVIGSIFQTMRVGVSRGVFTNEAGMGTASIAHAGAEVSHPCRQGLLGIMEVFLDTVVMCSLTALVILVSDVPIPYGEDPGGSLTAAAFAAVCGDWVNVVIAAALACFAFSTVLGWGLYGARCAQFLFGAEAWGKFTWLQIITVVLGAVLDTKTVWLLSETVNGLMAIPNLIALLALSGSLTALTYHYKSGGNYENIHQCKSLCAISHAEVSSLGGKSKAGR